MEFDLLVELSYSFVLTLIWIYKVIERFVLSLAYPIVKQIVLGKFDQAGIKLHFPKEGEHEVNRNASASVKDEDDIGAVILPGYEKEWILRVACDLELGLGEGFMDGIWECKNLDRFMYRMLTSEMYKETRSFRNSILSYLRSGMFNMQSMKRAFQVSSHYDTGNDLFEAFLDPTLSYSCGYWKDAKNLHQAQIAKLDLIAKKLKLKKGMTVLDIGCGWGGLAHHLSSKYDVKVVGLTISKEGAEYARELCKNLPVDIRLQDYRSIDERFDRVVSVGMFEHVGSKNYTTFMEIVERILKDDGLFVLHTIGVNHPLMERRDPWTLKYIFPNGELPYYLDLAKSIQGRFIIEDWHNFGFDYSKTLNAWNENFQKSWGSLKNKYGDKFFRMWRFYLETSEGAFASRKLNLWQLVLTKNGYKNGYESVR